MRLAVIGLFHQRHERTRDLLRAVLLEQTRRPDELWAMCESEEDARGIYAYGGQLARHAGVELHVEVLPTPRDAAGGYAVVPYSLKTNLALDRTSADYIAYLTNDSLPEPDKYRAMVEALDDHPDWGAVYCGQIRNGSPADVAGPVHDAACVLDHTQVMHRSSDARWTLDMSKVRVGDAWFWRELHSRFGPIHQVDGLLDHVWNLPDGISATHA